PFSAESTRTVRCSARAKPRCAAARSKHASRRHVYALRPCPVPGRSSAPSAWKRTSSACGALAPQPMQVRTGLLAVLTLLGLHELDRHTAERIVLDEGVLLAALRRLVVAVDRRIA